MSENRLYNTLHFTLYTQHFTLITLYASPSVKSFSRSIRLFHVEICGTT